MTTMTRSARTFSGWRGLGAVAPTALVAARETAHHAAQLLALTGASLVPARSDDSHTSMSWLDDHAALATQLVDAPRPFRIALRLHDVTLLALDARGLATAAFPLGGQTRAASLAWLRSRITAAGRDAAALRSSLHYTIAPNPTDDGAPFALPDDGALPELARWYASASAVLEDVAATTAGASPVACWPHHFDIATLITLPPGGTLRTIGVGMSPGDGSYAEPYYYVGPYPHPTSRPAALSVGRWHTEGWWGGALRASEIVGAGDAAAQAALVRRFIGEGIAALVALPAEG